MKAIKFDLNIGTILQEWTVANAIRELIANAMDEELLGADVRKSDITLSDKTAIIRDFGRGLRVEGFILNEDSVKRDNVRAMGKFGFGLKDAIATLYRHGIRVRIQSTYCDLTVATAEKTGVDDLASLHMVGSDTSDVQLGTRIELEPVSAKDFAQARAFFISLKGSRCVWSTPFGSLYERIPGKSACIFFNGFQVATDDGCLFDYDIVPTAGMREHLSRERNWLGRTVYRERIIRIVTAAAAEGASSEVAALLADHMSQRGDGRQLERTHCWELELKDIQLVAGECLARTRRNHTGQSTVVFTTTEQIQKQPHLVDEARSAHRELKIVPQEVYNSLNDPKRSSVVTFDRFHREIAEKSEAKLTDMATLTAEERRVFDLRHDILGMLPWQPPGGIDILVADELYRPTMDICGMHSPSDKRIYILRTQLQRVSSFAGTLVHEFCHSVSGRPDVDKVFESYLTMAVGATCERALQNVPDMLNAQGSPTVMSHSERPPEIIDLNEDPTSSESTKSTPEPTIKRLRISVAGSTI